MAPFSSGSVDVRVSPHRNHEQRESYNIGSQLTSERNPTESKESNFHDFSEFKISAFYVYEGTNWMSHCEEKTIRYSVTELLETTWMSWMKHS